jgi:NADPH:quinone reductase-like Zn-dependent oxidoreductase
LNRLVEMVDARRLRVPIAATYPLAQAAAALTASKQPTRPENRTRRLTTA